MADIEYWHKIFNNHVTDFEKKVTEADGLYLTDPTSTHIFETLSSKCEKDKVSLTHELRLIKEPDAKAGWKEKIGVVEEKLAFVRRTLASKKEQAELYGAAAEGGEGAGGRPGQAPGHQGPTNDQYLDMADRTHDDIESTLTNTLQVLGETEEIGAATLEQLAKQKDQIQDIHKTVLNIEDALKRSDALIRTFSKRMATDKMIQMFFMLNFLAVLGIVVYAVMKDQGIIGGGNDNAPTPAPVDDASLPVPTKAPAARYLLESLSGWVGGGASASE